jgi:hypothetical protein
MGGRQEVFSGFIVPLKVQFLLISNGSNLMHAGQGLYLSATPLPFFFFFLTWKEMHNSVSIPASVVPL